MRNVLIPVVLCCLGHAASAHCPDDAAHGRAASSGPAVTPAVWLQGAALPSGSARPARPQSEIVRTAAVLPAGAQAQPSPARVQAGKAADADTDGPGSRTDAGMLLAALAMMLTIAWRRAGAPGR